MSKLHIRSIEGVYIIMTPRCVLSFLTSCLSGEGRQCTFVSKRISKPALVRSVRVSSVFIHSSASFFFSAPPRLAYLSELTLILADRHTKTPKENGLEKNWLYHPEDFSPFFSSTIIFHFFHSLCLKLYSL